MAKFYEGGDWTENAEYPAAAEVPRSKFTLPHNEGTYERLPNTDVWWRQEDTDDKGDPTNVGEKL